jgi:hypothetical protein
MGLMGRAIGLVQWKLSFTTFKISGVNTMIVSAEFAAG